MKIIDYSLYWLASQSINEVFICSTGDSDKLVDYFCTTNWNVVNLYFIECSVMCREKKECTKGLVTSPIIHFYAMPNCSSTGDILREVDSRSLIECNSFLLVNCGAITNLDITSLWHKHTERHNLSSSNVMTSVFTHIPYDRDGHRDHDIAVALNKSNQILAYSDIKNEVIFPLLTESFLDNDAVRFTGMYDIDFDSI